MRSSLKKIFIVGVLLVGLNIQAQQEAMITQFALNMMSINPGYAGYREVQSFAFVHRSQWVGYKGAPVTDILAFDMALKRKELAIGGSIMNDKIGPSSELGVTANFAYRLKVTPTSTLSLGLQAYGGTYQANLTDLALVSEYVGSEIDQNFDQNPDNIFLPNFGFGAFYHNKKSFVGLSSPKLLRNRLDNATIELIRSQDGRTEPTYFFAAGHTITLDREYALQPVMISKATAGAPISLGGYLNFLFKDIFKVGLVYYHQEVAGILTELKLNHRMRVGYSFDMPITGLATYSYGSHEISATYEMKVFKQRLVYSRRF
ncbi:MAG: type IX secretion system PorP/SprF family membrane protein [Patiriisocius sp.]|jgi:type IX secretion system PorP/SprF family membrane protein